MTLRGLFAFIAVCLLATASISQTIEEPQDFEAILAADQADGRVRLISAETPAQTLWAFPPESAKPDAYKPTDAKKVEFEGKTCILVSYHGRVRLIRFEDQKVLKDYPSLGSCHSVEMLPDGKLVSANSNHNTLRLHLDAEKFFDLPLTFAHGVVWDKAGDCLWAVGDELYQVRYEKDSLSIVEKFSLPGSPSGHDLFPVAHSRNLLVSDNEALYIFSPEKKSFATLSTIRAIKSASRAKDGSAWITEPMKIEGAAPWHSDTIARIEGDQITTRITLPGARFYKARWWQGR